MRNIAWEIARNFLRLNQGRLQRNLRGRRDGPWMRPQEENIIREVLAKQKPVSCLEWGAGFSTLHFPALLDDVPGSTWLSIEHDQSWTEMLRQMNTRANVVLVHVPPNVGRWTGDGNSVSFGDYLAHPKSFAPFDFILVDGRARSDALRVARGMLATQGLVVLHDANRSEYAAACGEYTHQLLLQDSRVSGHRPAGGIWVGSCDRPIETVLDVGLHRRIWNFYRGAGRLFA